MYTFAMNSISLEHCEGIVRTVAVHPRPHLMRPGNFATCAETTQGFLLAQGNAPMATHARVQRFTPRWDS